MGLFRRNVIYNVNAIHFDRRKKYLLVCEQEMKEQEFNDIKALLDKHKIKNVILASPFNLVELDGKPL